MQDLWVESTVGHTHLPLLGRIKSSIGKKEKNTRWEKMRRANERVGERGREKEVFKVRDRKEEQGDIIQYLDLPRFFAGNSTSLLIPFIFLRLIWFCVLSFEIESIPTNILFQIVFFPPDMKYAQVSPTFQVFWHLVEKLLSELVGLTLRSVLLRN